MSANFSKYVSNESKLAYGAWFVVGSLFIVGALNYLDRTTITTMRSSILMSIPMTDAQFGLLTSVFLWVYGLLSPFAGFVADRFKRSWVIVGSLFVWSVVTFLTSYATTFGELLTTRALMGVSEAFYLPASMAMIVDYHKGRTRSLATGINIAGTMFGSSLGFIGGRISESHPWNYAFYIFGVIGMLLALFLLFFLKDAPSTRKDTSLSNKKEVNNVRFFEAVKDLFRRRSFIYLFIFWGILGVIGWMIIGWLPTYYKENFNLSQGLAGFYATAYLYPFSILGSLLGGFLADRWSKKNQYARILIPICGLFIAAPCIFVASNTAILTITIIFFMIYAISRMFVDSNLMPMLCMVVDERYRATGYGLLNMFGTIVGGIGIVVMGVLRDSHINLGVMYQIASLSIIICVLLLFGVKKYAKKFNSNDLY